MPVGIAAQTVDLLVALLALFASAILIIRLRFPGVLLAAATFYLLTLVRIELRYVMHPNWEGGIGDTISLLGSLTFGAVWCVVILLGKLYYDWRKRSNDNAAGESE